MTGYEILAYSALIVVLYSIIANRLIRLAEPVRMEIAERGEALVADERLPEEIRDVVEYMMDRAFSSRIVWYFALTYWLGSIFAVVDQIRGRPEALSKVPHDMQSEVRHVLMLGIFSVLAVSPLATALLIIQIVISMAVFVPVKRATFRALRITSTIITGHRWGGDHHHA